MHVIKYTRRGDVRRDDADRLKRARAKASPVPAERIASEALASFGGGVGPELLAGIARLFGSWVASEARFVGGRSEPASKVAEFYENQPSREREFAKVMASVAREIVERVSLPSQNGPSVLSIDVPLSTFVRDKRTLVQSLVERLLPLNFDGGDLVLGAGLAKEITSRLCRASGLSTTEAEQRPHRLKWPKEHSADGDELINLYLVGTVIAELLALTVSIPISDAVRMEHCLMTAGAGHGKTQTLEHMIARDIERGHRDKVGLVVIDSQGDLIRNIERQKLFAGNDRLMIVDASDVEYPVALNIFNLGGSSSVGLSPREAEQATSAAVQLYEYVIGGLFGAELTSKQAVVFSFLVRLMLSIPKANIHTLRECLEEPKQFMHYMEKLPATARAFFLNEFFGREFSETRKQLLRRLYGVLQNPAFERMFASSENKIDVYKALNEGRVVLVNTSREFLHDECRVFGRYMIAVTLKAAFDRARLPLEQRRTSFLYIDEASDYFDESVGQLLAQARKYRLGCVLAHQALDQMSDGLRAVIVSNTAIKLAGGVSAKDARSLASDLRTTPEFILAQEKTNKQTRFATFVRNVTPQAVSWTIAFFALQQGEKMSDAEYAKLIERNRREVSSGPAVSGRLSPSVSQIVPDDDGDDGSLFSETY